MPDLTTRYMGLRLAHPVVAAASPLSRSLDGVKRLEDAGAAAIVLVSLFEEHIHRDKASVQHLSAGTESFPESLSYFPPVEGQDMGPDEYIELLHAAKAAVDVPIVASLNGVTNRGWTRYAALLQSAGADAIELNIFHIPVSADETSNDVEARYLKVVGAVRDVVTIPLAIKLAPYFSSFPEMARRLAHAGADGLVLFNRFYQPDFDIDQLVVAPTLSLSSPAEIRLPLLWIAVLRGRLSASLAATTGVDTHVEVVKYLLAGADVVMTASALLRHGPDHLRTLVAGLDSWLGERGYESVAQMRGSMSQRKVADPTTFERANYMRILGGWADTTPA